MIIFSVLISDFVKKGGHHRRFVSWDSYLRSCPTGNAGIIGLVLGITTVSLVVLSVVVLLLWSCRRGSSHHTNAIQDKRGKSLDSATALGT